MPASERNTEESNGCNQLQKLRFTKILQDKDVKKVKQDKDVKHTT